MNKLPIILRYLNSPLSYLLIFVSVGMNSYSQVFYSGNATVEAFSSQEEELPFWFYTNQRGRISKETNIVGLVSGMAHYKLSEETSLEIGAGGLFQDGHDDQFSIDELYAELNYNGLQITAGKKQRPELYNGLSATNENILWSLNAQPLPGVQIRTGSPVYFSKSRRFGFEASWSEYLMGNQEYVQDTRVHSKSFHLVYNFRNWKFKAGMWHMVQWGGISPRYGDLPTGITDYLRVISGRAGGENALETDQLNAIGNHLGSYELYVDKTFEKYELGFIYNSILENGSGSRLANFPDGRYGLYLNKLETMDWFSGFIYEFYYTKNQSQTLPHLYDDYFNSGVYVSGWTYQQRVIGLPFLTTNYYDNFPRDGSSISIGNSMVLVHHLGISGFALKNMPYKLLMSYRKNYGHYKNTSYAGVEHYPLDDPRGALRLEKNILSTYLDVRLLKSFLNFGLKVGGDFSRETSNFGAGLSLQKQF